MLTIHRSERADRLVAALADVLATPPSDPFTPEVVAVPSRGVERWISQGLATRLGTGPSGSDGVCANVSFPAPGTLLADEVARATGVDPQADPWSATHLPWSLLEVIDSCATESWCQVLGTHLGFVGAGDVEHRRGRRVAVAQKLARLYTAYAAQRPEMVLEWLSGRDDHLDPDLAWQAELMRRLRIHIGSAGPAERLDIACSALREHPDASALPERISIFGPTRLAAAHLRVLDALSAGREVHLWLPHPSPGLWDRLAVLTADPGLRSEDPTAELPSHPLVRSLGRDVREMQTRLAAHCPGAAVVHHPADPEHTSLLGRLQRDLRDDRAPGGGPSAPADRSVQVHACHGRLRQVEVMREVVLGLLDDDPSLELRDFVVMCPDIETFAPLISATFGLVDADDDPLGHPAHQLRVRLADRALRQTNPVLSVLGRLLDLADARVTASEVLDFAALGPVRRKFGFEDEDLETLSAWVTTAGVRWGLDQQARAPYSLTRVPQGTWRSGLDRLLVGVAMDEQGLRTFAGVLPVDDVGSGDIDLVGRVAELIDRLDTVVGALSGDAPLAEWIHILEAALTALTDVSTADGWQVTQARQQLAEAMSAAGERAAQVPVKLADVRVLFADLLRGRPTRSSFRTGHLTVCSMVPMRSVPHRVVVLLGLDDETFPRQPTADGDDVLARRPHVGEQDPRSEDRQLLLDAITSAQDTLVALYSGNDERTGATRPPAVPLAEVLDVLRVMTPSGGEAESVVLIRHPLQPFDPKNYRGGELVPGHPFSFDPAGLMGGRALVGARVPRPAFVVEPLPPESVPDVALRDLGAFLANPSQAFLRQRLRLAMPADEADAEDLLSVELRGLDEWQVGSRLLEAALRGDDRDATIEAEYARGTLPPGPLGSEALGRILTKVDALISGSRGLRGDAPQHVEVDLTLSGGTRLHGSVGPVYGDRIVRIEYSKLRPRHRLQSWLQLLSLSASRPTTTWRTLVAGRADAATDIAYSFVDSVEPALAREYLEQLLELYLEGRRRPLPLMEECSERYAERRLKGVSPDAATRAAEELWRQRFGDASNAAVRQVWGEVEFGALLREPPTAGSEEASMFGDLAVRLWHPLLGIEAVRSA